MSVTTRLFAVLLDGKEHHSADILWFLKGAVAPNKAAEVYKKAIRTSRARHKRLSKSTRTVECRRLDLDAVPMDTAIDKGAYTLVRQTMYLHSSKGRIVVTKGKIAFGDFRVRLTDVGRDHLFSTNALSRVMKELKAMVRSGAVHLSVTPIPLADRCPDDADDRPPDSPVAVGAASSS